MSKQITQVNQLRDQAIQHLNNAATSFYQLGGVLNEVKAIVPHGTFKQWVADNMPIGYRQCVKFMTVASANPKVNPGSLLDINSEVLLTKLPEDERDQMRQELLSDTRKERTQKLAKKKPKVNSSSLLPEPKITPTPVIPQPTEQEEYPTYPCEVNFEDMSIAATIENLKFLTHYLKNVKVLPSIWVDATPHEEALLKQEVQVAQREAFDTSEKVIGFYIKRMSM